MGVEMVLFLKEGPGTGFGGAVAEEVECGHQHHEVERDLPMADEAQTATAPTTWRVRARASKDRAFLLHGCG